MKNNFSKNDLIFYYQKGEFPHDLILKEVLVHKEFLFSAESQEPEFNFQSKKKVKLSTCYVMEEETDGKKGSFKKGKANQRSEFNIMKGNNFSNPSNNFWKKGEFEDPGFFDNFKGKTDEKQINFFKRNLELALVQENSISIDNKIFVDHLDKDNQTFKKIDLNAPVKNNPSSRYLGNSVTQNNPTITTSLKEITATADEIFNNDNIFGISKQNEKKITIINSSPAKSIQEITLGNFPTLTNDEKSIVYSLQDPKKVDFRNVYRINKCINYANDQPLWYILHPKVKSSFGPCSTDNLEEMYSGGMVDGQTEIRFIEIFNMKNKPPFSFFKLKDLEDSQFLDNIEISNLIKSVLSLCNLTIISETELANVKDKNNDHDINNKINDTVNTNILPKNPNKNVANNSNNKPINIEKNTSSTNQNDVKKPQINNNKSNVPKNIKSENRIPGLHVTEKEPIANLSNIPTIEDLNNMEKNQNKKEKNYSKKPTKAKPISLDVKLKFEENALQGDIISASYTTTNDSNIQKSKENQTKKPKNTQAEEHMVNSIYAPVQHTEAVHYPPNIYSLPIQNTQIFPVEKSLYSDIETVQIQDESIYNNYGYDKGFSNNYEFDYYEGNNNRKNQRNRKNSNNQNEIYEHDYNNDYQNNEGYYDGYAKNNYGGNRNYKNNYGYNNYGYRNSNY